MQEAFFNSLHSENPNLVPARVTFASHDHFRVMLLGLLEEQMARPRGHFYHGGDELPVVGDWVAVEYLPGDHAALPIEQVLPRRTLLQRPHRERGQQSLVANVEHICLVTSFSDDLNVRRLERGLAMINDSGAQAIVVINKSDLVDHQLVVQTRQDLCERLGEIPIIACSAQSAQGLDELVANFKPGESVTFLGMSGVGKSTLINAILGEERLNTTAIRADDGRGRHTTTHRELIRAKSGFWLVDSPGIRGFSVAGDESSMDDVFQEIAALMQKCKFGNCSHTQEPGCAVLTALQNGVIDNDRWQNFLKVKKEIEFHTHKHDKAFRSEQRKEWAKVSKNLRQRLKAKGKK